MDCNHIVRRYFYLYRDDKFGERERKQKVSDTVATIQEEDSREDGQLLVRSKWRIMVAL